MRDKKVTSELFKNILIELGEDCKRTGLLETPRRMAEVADYLTSGYHEDIDSLVNNALFPTSNKDIVIVKNIEFYSLCEHHLLPFWGTCTIGYVPDTNVIGLSKIPKIVDMYSRRLQIQEQLTCDIANALQYAANASGVIVHIEAQHLCMMMRGVEKQNATTITRHVAGSIDQSSENIFSCSLR